MAEQHDALTALGRRWLHKQGFPIVATEIAAIGCRERADVIGFRSSCSAVIEVKVTRGDFLADARKPERESPGLGLGTYRFYLCPLGLIRPEEVPAKWGLLYADCQKVQKVVSPIGNVWPGGGSAIDGWAEYQHVVSAERERAVLFSIARRLSSGESI
jgi:hypothetical protein